VLAFALATDYEVFVIARIKEAHDHGLPDREAIALGIERTGRVRTPRIVGTAVVMRFTLGFAQPRRRRAAMS
jgi:uncharacterized membrane protein YdfJ with MMPL/SSD domain